MRRSLWTSEHELRYEQGTMMKLGFEGIDRRSGPPAKRFRSRVLALAVMGLMVGGMTPIRVAAAPADGRPPAVTKALENGLEDLSAGRLRRAIRRLRKAEELAPEGSVLARLALAKCYELREDYDEQIRMARHGLELATTPELQSDGHALLAAGLKHRAERDETTRTEDRVASAAAYRKAYDLIEPIDPRGGATSYLFEEGELLLLLGRDREGTEAILQYLRLAPNGRFARLARSYAEKPARAREPMLPDMEIEALSGERLTDESLEGEVVVLDFWATWCIPCRATLPTLERLHELGKETGLVTVISISDEPGDKVRRFAGKHGMDWTLALDPDRRIAAEIFGIQSLPTIILADHEGRILYRVNGWASAYGTAFLEMAESAVEEVRRERGSE